MTREWRFSKESGADKDVGSLLSYFPCSLTPRPVQEYVLNEVERVWNWNDVIVIRAAVGSGKSGIAYTIAKWQEAMSRSTSIITPTNPLVNQYTAEFPELASIGHKGGYRSEDAYTAAQFKFKKDSCKVANYYTYLAHRAYSETLIADESHRLLGFLLDLNGFKLWHHYTPFPEFRNMLEVVMWAEKNKDVDKRIAKLAAYLRQNPEHYTLEIAEDECRGRTQPCLRVHPLSPREAKPILWPARVKKIVLMSATIGEEDLYDMGLDKRRVKFIDGGSAIPTNRRPIVYSPIGNMSYTYQDANIPKLIGFIKHKMELFKGHKGMVHMTYALARKLRAVLPEDMKDKLLFHSALNKGEVLRKFLNATEDSGLVLVGCGLTEGLDLAHGKGRWQIVAKMCYPNKSDVAVATRLEQRPKWYVWQAVKDLEQAVGRICRGPDDVGVSYIVDSAFWKLYNEHSDMFSVSFKEALQWDEQCVSSLMEELNAP
jgi:Rad3-related DNA helicase